MADKTINQLTVEATTADADELAVWDASASATRKMTLATILAHLGSVERRIFNYTTLLDDVGTGANVLVTLPVDLTTCDNLRITLGNSAGVDQMTTTVPVLGDAESVIAVWYDNNAVRLTYSDVSAGDIVLRGITGTHDVISISGWAV